MVSLGHNELMDLAEQGLIQLKKMLDMYVLSYWLPLNLEIS